MSSILKAALELVGKKELVRPKITAYKDSYTIAEDNDRYFISVKYSPNFTRTNYSFYLRLTANDDTEYYINSTTGGNDCIDFDGFVFPENNISCDYIRVLILQSLVVGHYHNIPTIRYSIGSWWPNIALLKQALQDCEFKPVTGYEVARYEFDILADLLKNP